MKNLISRIVVSPLVMVALVKQLGVILMSAIRTRIRRRRFTTRYQLLDREEALGI